MPYKDSEKRKAAQRRWHHKNKTRVSQSPEVRNAAKKRRKLEMSSYVASLKDKPCFDCEKSYPPYVMEYDHVSGDKLDSVSNLVRDGYQRDVIEAEIAKCELVCSNCHKIRHYSNVSSEAKIEASV